MSKFEISNIYKECNGILHIGANSGQEAQMYANLKKPVLWIEADPNLYKKLQKNIAKHSEQLCINALITDKDNAEYIFRIASNSGGSSSIFEFNKYVNVLYPKLSLETSNIILCSQTIDTVLKKNVKNICQYDFLILDIQGAELLALRGAENYISQYCKYIYTEVSTKEIYKGGVLYDELEEYLNTKNFYTTEQPEKEHTNVLFKRIT